MAVALLRDGPAQKLVISLPLILSIRGMKLRVGEDRAILAGVLSPIATVFASFCLLAAPTVFAQVDSDAGSLDDQTEGRVLR